MTVLSPRLQPLFEKTKTVCFGRFLIDVPVTATVVYGPVDASTRIERLPDEGGELSEYVAKRETELKSEIRYPRTKGLNRYEKTLDGAIPGQKILVGLKDFDGDFYKVESYIRLGNDLYIQETQAPVEPYRLTDQQAGRPLISSLDDAIAELNTSARRLRARADNEIPDAPASVSMALSLMIRLAHCASRIFRWEYASRNFPMCTFRFEQAATRAT